MFCGDRGSIVQFCRVLGATSRCAIYGCFSAWFWGHPGGGTRDIFPWPPNLFFPFFEVQDCARRLIQGLLGPGTQWQKDVFDSRSSRLVASIPFSFPFRRGPLHFPPHRCGGCQKTVGPLAHAGRFLSCDRPVFSPPPAALCGNLHEGTLGNPDHAAFSPPGSRQSGLVNYPRLGFFWGTVPLCFFSRVWDVDQNNPQKQQSPPERK